MGVPHYMISAVVGMQHRPEWPRVERRVLDKSRVELRSEPGNKYDRYAVQVLFEGHHIGYIPKHDSQRVSDLLKKGFLVQGTVSYRPAMRLRLAWYDDDPDWLK